ncbi:MAG TPA: Na(+)/H(+) antiporter subunit B [Azospirillum sp.]|nr:Na(+)/H(+) antiporter subunit B [Azospirillum sp.]
MGADRVVRAGLAGTAAISAGLLAWGAVALPRAPRIGAAVEERLADSGVAQPVTAVLLNFRGHDTLVEVAVLLLAAAGVYVMAPVGRASPAATEPLERGPGMTPVVGNFSARLAPMAVLLAAHLWWAGSTLPGGAFQAGTVLAGAAVGLFLTGRLPARTRHWGLRAGMAAGLVVFLAAAAAPVAAGGAYLEYPPGLAKAVIVTVEGVLTLSIGACLAALVVGVPPPRP